jgi:crotonobetainyl-CoA:carnitine CoA-transferase CaiB-like acyl-CoA transferase
VPPRLGEHQEEVLGRLLGMSDEEARNLAQS